MTVSPDLDRRFREAAATLGLVDIGFDVVDTPIGELLVAASDRGARGDLVRPEPDDRARAARPDRRPARPPLAAKRRRRRAASSTSTSQGAAARSTSPLDLRALPPFTVSVLDELARVPYGETTTYGALAQRVGRPRAARAVGTVMNRNRIPIVLPCHRVVGSTRRPHRLRGRARPSRPTLLELEGAR